jgi:hypothetical protein
VPIFRDQLAFVVPPAHRLARRRVVDITESATKLSSPTSSIPYRWRVIQLFESTACPCA